MKQRLLALTLALTLAVCTGYAQQGGSPIHVTTVIHNDGTRTDTVKNSDARTSETKTYSASQKLLERCVYTLDEQGREVEGVVYDDRGAITARVFFQYDAAGNLAERLQKAPNGMLQRRFVHTRDAMGRVIIQAFDARGKLLPEDCSIIAPPPLPQKKGGGKK